MNTSTKISVVVLLMAAVSFTAAADPQDKWIGYSGFLQDQNLLPVNGTHVITFRIWDQETGGTQQWKGSYSIDFYDGEFSVELGSVTDGDSPNPWVDVNFHANTQYWLGVSIDGLPELAGRKRLLFVPYAFKAEIETRTSDPASPVTGQIWLRTDL